MYFSREALKLWKQRLGSDATYTKLIGVFEHAGYKHYSENIRRIMLCQENCEEMCDSDSDEEGFTPPQPQTYPNHKPLSPVAIPDPQISESYINLDPATHTGGKNQRYTMISFFHKYHII